MARTWFKQMHGFYRHPKTLEAGEDAANLFQRCVDYATEFLTDGFISAPVMRELSRKRDLQKHIDALVRVGYLDVDPDGWWIHNFLEHHPSKAEVEIKRAKERQRKGSGK